MGKQPDEEDQRSKRTEGFKSPMNKTKRKIHRRESSLHPRRGEYERGEKKIIQGTKGRILNLERKR